MTKHYRFSLFIAFLIYFLFPYFAEAQVDSKVTRMLNWQLEALKENSYKNFIRQGNNAFKEVFTKFDFEALYLNTKSKLNKEYNVQYLASIRRVGMIEYLWKYKNQDTENEHLIRMSLSKNGESVVGFDFD
jgi:hypothetical protein